MLQISSCHTYSKKRCLDHNDVNNYQPVSNLCLIAKILEKLVLSQVSSYLNSHNLCNTCQSAYRPGHSTETALLVTQVSSYLNSHNLCNTCKSVYYHGHSTETALLKVVDDLFLSLSKGNISVLALTFLQHLTQLIILSLYTVSILTGFTDTVLQWFSFYQSDRTHYVSI